MRDKVNAMEYFYLTQDKNVSNIVEPQEMTKAINKEYVKNGKFQYMDKEPMQFYVKDKSDNVYPDYIQNPFHLVSDGFKQELDRLQKYIFFKPIVLADIKRMKQVLYWLVIPEIIDCLSFDKIGSVKKLVIDEKRVGYLKVFKVKGLDEDYIIVDSDVREALLASKMLGVSFVKVSCS